MKKWANFFKNGLLWIRGCYRRTVCVWTGSRSQEWWDCGVGGFYRHQNFRMSRRTFDYICQHLSARLSRQDTHLRRPVSLRKCVGVGLYWLGNGRRLPLSVSLHRLLPSPLSAMSLMSIWVSPAPASTELWRLLYYGDTTLDGLRLDCSDWGRIAKRWTCIQIRTIRESDLKKKKKSDFMLFHFIFSD